MIKIRSAGRVIAMLGLLLTTILVLAPSAAAAPAAAPAAPAAAANGSYLRLAHLSPDTPNVDVYVASASTPSRSFVVRGVGYGAVSDYTSLPADTYTVSMRPAGAAASSPAVISAIVRADPGKAYTVAGLGMNAKLSLKILDDDLTIPAAGNASVRVINASAKSPTLDIGVAGGPSVATAVAFGDPTTYRTVPIGNWTLHVEGSGKSSDLPITLSANAVYTVVVIDNSSGFAAALKQDGSGPGVIPRGSVETGFGGAVDPQGPAPADIALTATLVAASVAAGLLAVRVTRYRRAPR